MLQSLWRKRSYRFWADTLPYFRYAFMGGLTTSAVVILLVAGYWYARLMRDFPSNFPYVWILVAVLTFAVFPASIRTYLHRADLVYLLPLEADLPKYLKSAFRAAYIKQIVLILLLALVTLPIYRVGRWMDGESVSLSQLLLITIALMVIKVFCIYAYWREGQFREDVTRLFYRYIRLFVTAVYIYLLLHVHIALSIFIGSALLLCYIFLLKIPAAFPFHWVYFVKAEERAKERVYTFLSWFADVPESKRTIKRRKLLTFLDRWIEAKQSNAYRYLYWKFFQRSDIFPIVVRLSLTGIVFVSWLSHPYWKLFMFLFFALLIAAQLTSLYSFHLHQVWSQVYPISDKQRSKSAAFIVWWIYFAVILFMDVAFILSTRAIALGWSCGITVIIFAAAYRYFQSKASNVFSLEK